LNGSGYFADPVVVKAYVRSVSTRRVVLLGCPSATFAPSAPCEPYQFLTENTVALPALRGEPVTVQTKIVTTHPGSLRGGVLCRRSNLHTANLGIASQKTLAMTGWLSRYPKSKFATVEGMYSAGIGQKAKVRQANRTPDSVLSVICLAFQVERGGNYVVRCHCDGNPFVLSRRNPTRLALSWTFA